MDTKYDTYQATGIYGDLAVLYDQAKLFYSVRNVPVNSLLTNV
jgi:hypothetical protein